MRTLLACLLTCLLVYSCSSDNAGTPGDGGSVTDGSKTGDGGSGSGDAAGDGGGNTGDGGGSTGDGGGSTGDGGGSTGDGGAAVDWRSGTADGKVGVDLFRPTGDAATGSNPGNIVTCNGKVRACGDGKDNDNDGKIDAADPECTGPCDDDEGSFGTGIPGDNKDPCKQDCFFDGNSGAGDDKCEWNLKCDPASPGAPKCPYDPNFKNCPAQQKPDCIKLCRAVTPNGCDCFGCCEIFTSQGKFTVYLGSGPTCSLATPQNCTKCTQTTNCLNPCGECELCLGKTIADLPAKCFNQPPGNPDAGTTQGDGSTGVPRDAGVGPTSDLGISDSGSGGANDGGIVWLPICPSGQSACLDNSWCATGYYCITGCCIKGIL